MLREANQAAELRERICPGSAIRVSSLTTQSEPPVSHLTRAVSSAGEHSVYTRGVGGSIPSPPTGPELDTAHREHCVHELGLSGWDPSGPRGSTKLNLLGLRSILQGCGLPKTILGSFVVVSLLRNGYSVR